MTLLASSIERCSRAYYLSKKKKVNIGGPTNIILRVLSVSTSTDTVGFTCLVLEVLCTKDIER